jgi:opacity protein-like surface antigen
MRLLGIVVLGCAAQAMAATPAAAQSADPRGFVRAMSGLTFVTETSGMVSGGAAVNLTRRVAIVGEVGRLTNVLPKSLQDDLDDAAPLLEPQFGRPLRIDGGARAVYGLAGVRLTGRASGRATPFVEAMAGAARGTSVIHATTPGSDVSSSVERALGMPRSETHPMFTVGGGVSIAAGRRAAVEIGYRYARIQLGADDPKINTSALNGAIRVGF